MAISTGSSRRTLPRAPSGNWWRQTSPSSGQVADAYASRDLFQQPGDGLMDIAARFGDNLMHCHKLADLSPSRVERPGAKTLHDGHAGQLASGQRPERFVLAVGRPAIVGCNEPEVIGGPRPQTEHPLFEF